ncbi:MAG TPA: hypothetical protein VIJ57_14225 [Hanamia sp.]
MTPFNQNSVENTSVKYLLQLCSIVFLGYLILGISFGTLPGFITKSLHYDSLVVGIVLSIQVC